MNLHEIENMTAAELKADKSELIELAKAEPVADLAARYVQARTDAKIRDEAMAVQGTTITQLGAALESLTKERDGLKTELAQEKQAGSAELARVDKLRKDSLDILAQAAEHRAKTLAELEAQFAAMTESRNAAQSLAVARRAALATLMNTISPLLAAE